MAEHMAILVSSNQHLDYVIKIARAAHKKGKKVSIFFTGKGVLLTLAPQFKALCGKAALAVCDISFRSFGLHGREADIPGVTRRDFISQSKYAELLKKADRHLVF